MRNLGLIAILIGAAACGGGGDGGAFGSISTDELGAEMAEIVCSKAAECCTPEEFMEETLADDEAECLLFYEGLADELLVPVLEDSIAAGRVVYDGAALAECFAALEAMTCAEYNEAQAGDSGFVGCEDPFDGQVADDGECANDWDCVSGYCSGDTMDFEGNVTFGVCAAPPTAGMPCDDNDCVDGAWCDSSQAEPVCAEPQPDGSPCTFDRECESEQCGETVCEARTVCDGVS